jgi:hypothetical protein
MGSLSWLDLAGGGFGDYRFFCFSLPALGAGKTIAE